jgi:hypothetical protein
MYKCKECGGVNITQKLTIYVDPTDCGSIDISDGFWDDEFWCDDCDDSVDVKHPEDIQGETNEKISRTKGQNL